MSDILEEAKDPSNRLEYNVHSECMPTVTLKLIRSNGAIKGLAAGFSMKLGETK
jgi:hypothetical protein